MPEVMNLIGDFILKYFFLTFKLFFRPFFIGEIGFKKNQKVFGTKNLFSFATKIGFNASDIYYAHQIAEVSF